MAESTVEQTVIGFSTSPESAYNTNPVTAAGFTPMVTTVRETPVVAGEKTDDLGRIGTLESEAPSFQRSGFQIPTSFEISDTVQVGTFAPLLRRGLGKAAATPSAGNIVEAGIAFRQIFYISSPNVEGHQNPSTSFLYMNNEYDWLLTGGCISTGNFQQQGASDPTLTLGVVCSGNKKRVAVDYPSFGTLALPPTDPYMYGASSKMQYTDDGSTTVSLTTPSHKLRGQSFMFNNNLVTDDTRSGMPQVDATEPRRGWYRDFLHFGTPREVSGEFTMGMDGDYSLKNAEELNLQYTNWIWEMNGDNIPSTAAGNKYQLKIIVPKFSLRTPASGDAAGSKKTKTFTLFPLRHSAHYGRFRIEIINGVATAIA